MGYKPEGGALMADKTSEKTLTARRLALGHLTEAKGKSVSMRVFLGLMGTTDKSRVTRGLIKPLRKSGHDIISLAGGGYMLATSSPSEDRIINKIAGLETMVASLRDKYHEPAVSVPESVPSDKPRKMRSATRASALEAHPLLINTIAEAVKQGRPFTKTGRPGSNGIYVRRIELPAPYNSIGRDRLEGIVSELLNLEELGHDEAGFMVVTGS
jgi:hypothetical protein